jgi:DNA modification methylase
VKPYYDRDGITIFHADCADVLPSVDPADVGLLLTDPPYGINLDTDYANRRGGKRGHVVHQEIVGDSEPFDPTHLLGYSRLVLWGANNYPPALPPGGGFVWRKTNPHPYGSECELAWTNLTRRIQLWSSIRPATGRPGLHPSEKPVDLMRWIVEKWTKPGDLVLDPYMGSGPIAQACHDLGRRYIGVEVVEDYCKVAARRLAQGVLDFAGGLR